MTSIWDNQNIIYLIYIYICVCILFFVPTLTHIMSINMFFFFFFNLCKKEVNSIVSTKYERDCNVHMTPNSILDYLISPHSNATNVFFFFFDISSFISFALLTLRTEEK